MKSFKTSHRVGTLFSKGRKYANVYVLVLVQKEPAGQPIGGSHSATTKAMSEARGQEAGN